MAIFTTNYAARDGTFAARDAGTLQVSLPIVANANIERSAGAGCGVSLARAKNECISFQEQVPEQLLSRSSPVMAEQPQGLRHIS